MARVFLNHKSQDKAVVVAVRDHLARCLVSSWLDSDETVGGARLDSAIRSGIKACPYFVAFISHRYARSDWCMHELEQAEARARKGAAVIIPVLLDPVEELEMGRLPPDRTDRLESLLDGRAVIRLDRDDPGKGIEEIAAAIGKHEQIRFLPVERTAVGGEEVQLVRFRITAEHGILPSGFLRGWGLDFQADFLAYHDGEANPFRAGLPVAFNGKGPCWLYAYLAVCFKNLCPVYVFNHPSSEYVCVYDSALSSERLGAVLKPG